MNKTLHEMSKMLKVDEQDLPKTLARFKKEVNDMEHALKRHKHVRSIKKQ
jgi:hypothetical protein